MAFTLIFIAFVAAAIGVAYLSYLAKKKRREGFALVATQLEPIEDLAAPSRHRIGDPVVGDGIPIPGQRSSLRTAALSLAALRAQWS